MRAGLLLSCGLWLAIFLLVGGIVFGTTHEALSFETDRNTLTKTLSGFAAVCLALACGKLIRYGVDAANDGRVSRGLLFVFLAFPIGWAAGFLVLDGVVGMGLIWRHQSSLSAPTDSRSVIKVLT